jgi:hypothetical protein
MHRERASALELRWHRAVSLEMLNDTAAKVADMHLVGRTEVALANNAKRTLFDCEFREFARDRLDESVESGAVLMVAACIKPLYRFNITLRSRLTEPLLQFGACQNRFFGCDKTELSATM